MGSAADVPDREVAMEIARALQKWESELTAEYSIPYVGESGTRPLLLRFATAPWLQCFFIPMRTRDNESGRWSWAWFRPVSSKASCVICGGKHGEAPCPRIHRLPLPSTYRRGRLA